MCNRTTGSHEYQYGARMVATTVVGARPGGEFVVVEGRRSV